MLLWGRLDDSPLLLGRQNGGCEVANGTQIGGSPQAFIVFCNTKFDGNILDRTTASSFEDCVGKCTQHQNPRCEGVVWNRGNVCFLKANIPAVNPSGDDNDNFLDSAMGILPNPVPSSNCAQIGSGEMQTVGGTNFRLHCGQVFQGNDIGRTTATTMQGCLSACTQTPNCGGIAYNANLNAGFINCYLKTAFNGTGLTKTADFDSANNEAAGAGSSVNLPPQPSTTTVVASAPPPDPTTILMTSIITVSGQPITTTVASSGQPVTMSTTLMVSGPTVTHETTKTEQGSKTTQTQTTTEKGNETTLTVTMPGNPSLGPVTSAQPPLTSNATVDSRAWVAGPAVGAVVAATLGLGFFTLWWRKRRQRFQDMGNMAGLGEAEKGSFARVGSSAGVAAGAPEPKPFTTSMPPVPHGADECSQHPLNQNTVTISRLNTTNHPGIPPGFEGPPK